MIKRITPVRGKTMSNKKQSSIEWLFLMMYNPNYGYEANQRLLDKAKELHKQETMDAVEYGCSDWGSYKDAEQYYKNTFEDN